jgi:hypothetical protein
MASTTAPKTGGLTVTVNSNRKSVAALVGDLHRCREELEANFRLRWRPELRTVLARKLLKEITELTRSVSELLYEP